MVSPMRNVLIASLLLGFATPSLAEVGRIRHDLLACRTEADLDVAAALDKLEDRTAFREFVAKSLKAGACVVLASGTEIDVTGIGRSRFFVTATRLKDGIGLFLDGRTIQYRPNSPSNL